MDSHDKDFKIFDKKDFDNGKTPSKDARNRWKNPNFLSSLDFALSGIWAAFKEERNMRKHLVFALLAILAGLFFKLSQFEWLFLFLAIFLVFVAELINSAIENVVDLASDYQFHMRAKRAKDMAAGAVLLISFFAMIVGLFIFLPKIWHWFF